MSGIRIRVRVCGHGPPLLLVMGIGANLDMWEPLVSELGERQLVAFDAPGADGSGNARFPMTMGQHAELVGKLLDRLGYARVDLLGVSWGGLLAQKVAITQPRRVRRLVLAPTLPGVGAVLGRPSALWTMTTPRHYYSREAFERVAPRLYGGRARTHPGSVTGDLQLRAWHRSADRSLPGWRLTRLSAWRRRSSPLVRRVTVLSLERGPQMAGIARDLAAWAHAVTPMPDDFELAERSLVDTVAVALAARAEPLVLATGPLGDAGRWATAAHVLDFDDVHIESTSHISALIVPVVLACGGGAREYLAGAGVMARLGSALGWEHYLLGWHATCTAGAPASAVAAAVALGLDPVATAHAMALAIPAAGGVQRAFGTDAKALQVGFAADAGVRAARLASAGARGDLSAVEQWLELVGAAAVSFDDTDAIVPGGLAIKLFPCCYAMQRPISAVRETVADVTASEVDRVVVTTPAGTVKPLIHHRPTTGLEGKFSMEYAVATAMLDGFPTLDCFTDAKVSRAAAQWLVTRVETRPTPGGDGVLAGSLDLAVHLRDGSIRTGSMAVPPGAAGRPPSREEFAAKIAGCGRDLPAILDGITWADAAMLLKDRIIPRDAAPVGAFVAS